MNKCIRAINRALSAISLARDLFAYNHAEDFDIDWTMEQFEIATVILERLRDEYERRDENV